MEEASAGVEEDVLLSTPMEVEPRQDADSANKVSTSDQCIGGTRAVLDQQR